MQRGKRTLPVDAKLQQQQLSDTSGAERGGGLAGELVNRGGEWTALHVDLEHGRFETTTWVRSR